MQGGLKKRQPSFCETMHTTRTLNHKMNADSY